MVSLTRALSLRASESPLVPASMPVGVKNAPSPVAGSGVALPAKDNATTSLLLGALRRQWWCFYSQASNMFLDIFRV